MEADESHIYGADILISSHTNRVIPSIEHVVTKLPIFWCDPCAIRLATPTQAIQHLTGKLHKVKVTPKEEEDGSRKRVLDPDGNPVEEPVSKRSKLQDVDQSIPCKECNIILNSPIMAEQHFKGKKHASALAKLTNATKPTVPAPTPVVNKATFCQFCNVTLNSDGQVKQHYSGNRHKINAGIIPPLIPPSQRGGGAARGRGQVHNSEENGRRDLDYYDGGRGGGRGRGERGRGERGRGDRGRGDRGRGERGRGDRGRGGTGSRGTMRGRARGDSNRGDSRGRGFGRGNSAVTGGGAQRSNWGRDQQNFSRGARGGGVPVGGQYGNDPPPFDGSSSNFQEIGSECSVPRSSYNDYNESPAKENFKPPTNFYNKSPLPNGPSAYRPPRNMQYNDQRDNLHDHGSTSKDYFGGSVSNVPPFNSSDLPPKNYHYNKQPPPFKSNDLPPKNYHYNQQAAPFNGSDPPPKNYHYNQQAAPFNGSDLPPKNYHYNQQAAGPPINTFRGGNGNYYSKGYNRNNNSHDGDKRNTSEFQMKTDAMYDSFYG